MFTSSPAPKVVLLAVLAAMFGCTQGSGPTGLSCGPAPTSDVQLGGAAAGSTADAWVVGLYQDNGPAAPLTEHWDGKRWTAVPAASGPQAKDAYLNAVAMIQPGGAWAVGTEHVIGASETLIEKWNGSTWSVVSSPSPGPSTNTLSAVGVIAADDAWATGDYQDQTQDRALTEHWNGSAWTVVAAPSPAAGFDRLTGVSGVAADDVWVVGSQRVSDSAATQMLIEHWDGHSWTTVTAPSPDPGRSTSLASVAAISADDVWAVGAYDAGKRYQPLIEHWDGATWSIVASPQSGDSVIQTVGAEGPDDVWIAGPALVEHWNGSRLTRLPNVGVRFTTLNAVLAVGGDAWVIGTYRKNPCGPDWGVIYSWNGRAWSYVPSPHDGRDGGF